MNKFLSLLIFGLLGISLILSFAFAKKETKLLVYFHATDKTQLVKKLSPINDLGKKNKWIVDTTSSPDFFTEENLKNYHALIFLETSGGKLAYAQKVEVERFVQSGGGLMAVNIKDQKENDWRSFDALLKAIFSKESYKQNATQSQKKKQPKNTQAEDHTPVGGFEGVKYSSYRYEINEGVEIISADFKKEGMGNGFSISIGEGESIYGNKDFLKHFAEGVKIISINKPDYSKAKTERVPEENRFSKVILGGDLDEPMMLDVAPDGSIYIIERKGALKRYYPDSKTIRTIATFNVFSLLEDGLLGFALDPDYEKNQFAYFYYSPPGDKPVQNVSRFNLVGDSLIKSSEKVLLEVAVQRETCCHSAGGLVFGPDGNLWISVGDNTSSKESNGYSPLDERPGRAPFDAQKSSANTQDLRGKILRIKPTEEGSYKIPAGNLFKDPKEGRLEIYVMGCRNPFRFSIDKRGYLYWGDVGPDGGKDGEQGPQSYDEFNQAKQPGYFGWPYFVADNKAYPDFDFATNKIGLKQDPKSPVNNSPNNTGSRVLPPAQKPMIWYPYGESLEFPYLGTGSRSAEAGPFYYFDDVKNSKNKFPKYYDGKMFIYEWARGWINLVTFDKDGNFQKIEPFLPNSYFSKPIHMVFGKDGAMYLLEYGENYFAKNPDARLAKIDYAENNRIPIAKSTADITEGGVPFTVRFSGKESVDHDKNDKLKYEWFFTDSKTVQSTEIEPSFTFDKPGVYKPVLKVTDSQGESNTSEITIKAGNNKPSVNLDIKDNNTFYWDNYSFSYEAKVEDKEDGNLGNGIDPSLVTLNIDYLPQGRDLALIMGHQYNTSVSKFEKGKLLIEGSDCKSCHSYTQLSVGPSYAMVAKRYKGDPKAVNLLAKKIITGGNGNWGDRLMSAHPQLNEEQTAEMVKYILSLADVKENYPVKGKFVAKEHMGQGEEGVYVFSLSYKDRGANGIEPLTATKINYLRFPKVEADEFQLSHEAGINRPNAGALAFASLSSDGSYFGFKSIDLTNIEKLTLRCSSELPEGSLEVYSDQAVGNLIGSALLKQSGKGWSDLDIALEATQGIHDLYFVLKKKDKNLNGSVHVDWIYFNRTKQKTASNKE